jgi:DNA-directed RNA polymerase specialized sigma24 family protein
MRLEDQLHGPANIVDADADAARRSLYDVAQDRLWALPARQRDAVWFHLMLRLRLRDVASVLECDLSTAKTHYYRGMRTLRQNAGADWGAMMDDVPAL